MKSKLELRKSRDFGQIISDSIVFVTQNWKSLLKAYFTFCGFFIAGSIIFSILFQFNVVNVHKESLSSGVYSRYNTFGIEYYMLLLFGLLNSISIVLTTCCYIVLYNVNNKTAPTNAEIWAYFKYYFWRTTGSFFLLLLIFIGGLIICVIPAVIVSAAISPLLGGLTGIICILVPLVYFITVLCLFFPVMLTENAGFGYSFSKTFKLIKGKWWSTFGVLFVMLVVVYGGYILISIPFMILSGGSITFSPYNVSTIITVLYCVCICAIQVLSILPNTASMVAYFSYVEDKESIGLLERIENSDAANGDDIDTVKEEY